jgi:hypothetical protein
MAGTRGAISHIIHMSCSDQFLLEPEVKIMNNDGTGDAMHLHGHATKNS